MAAPAAGGYGSWVDGQVEQPEVRAAGGVVWRPSSMGEPEVAIIHRPRYDDWSLPKGKLLDGESDTDAAVREVREETGLRSSLGPEIGRQRYRDRHGRSKEVRYWLMRPQEEGTFEPTDEVDRLEWVSIREALDRLTYERDREMLGGLDLT